MSQAHRVTRRRALKAIFCSSAALALNVRGGRSAPPVSPEGNHLLALGDYGTTGEFQIKVAKRMREFCKTNSLRTDGLLMLGDNFYSRVDGGFSTQSERWRIGFEDMYPTDAFPGPCWAVLGNHDYHDNAGGEKVQLAYAAQGKSRWTMPAKWHRFEIGSPEPVATVLALDSNLPELSGRKSKKTGERRGSLTKDEADEQLDWLRVQLDGPRAPFTLVMGHHPLYSNGSHGDARPLIETWGKLFEQHHVHAYMAGHDHDLQHLEMEDRFTSFVISGGGGARTRAVKSGSRSKFGQGVYGFTHLQIDPERVTFAHYGVDGALLHRFHKRLDGSVEIA